MRNVLSSLLALPLLVAGAQRAAAQPARVPPTRAIGVGWSPAAGLFGAELVARSFAMAPRLGGAAGVGFGGVGARLNVALRDPAAHRRVPYVGAGYSAALWLPLIELSGVTSLEGGVQFWPTAGRGMYLDLGGGVAYLTGTGDGDEFGPVIRLLVGGTF
jgi:hypothetical protein